MNEQRSYNFSVEKPIYVTNKNMFSPKKKQNNIKRKIKTSENESGTSKKKRKLYSSSFDIICNDKSASSNNYFNSASEYIRFKNKTSATLKYPQHNFNLDNKRKPCNNLPPNRIRHNPLKIDFESSPFKLLNNKNEQDSKLSFSKKCFKDVSKGKDNSLEKLYSNILNKIYTNKGEAEPNLAKNEITPKILRAEKNIETKINLKSSSIKTLSPKNELDTKILLSGDSLNYAPKDKNVCEPKNCEILSKIYTKSNVKQKFPKKDIKSYKSPRTENIQTKINLKCLSIKSSTENELNTKFLLPDPKCVSKDKNLCEPKYCDIYTKSEAKQNYVKDNSLSNLLQRRKPLLLSEQNSIQLKSISKSSPTKSSNTKIEKCSKSSLLFFDDKFNFSSPNLSVKKVKKLNTTPEHDSKLLFFATTSKLSPSKLSTKKSNSKKKQDLKKLSSVISPNFSPVEVSVKESNIKYEHNLKLLKLASVGNNSKRMSNDQNTFLASLSDSISRSDSHPDSLIYKENFKETKQELTERLFNLYNTEVFANKIPSNTTIEWSNRMVSTAGFTHNKRVIKLKSGEQIYSSRIKLSTKIVDRPSRLRDVLIHEMCHAITWIVHNIKDGHGTLWKTWAQKAMITFPSLPVIVRCHSYDVQKKYTYRCKECGYSFERHSKSVNIEQKCCGHCKGRFEVILNKN